MRTRLSLGLISLNDMIFVVISESSAWVVKIAVRRVRKRDNVNLILPMQAQKKPAVDCGLLEICRVATRRLFSALNEAD